MVSQTIPDIENRGTRIDKPVKRQIVPSAANIDEEEIFDFLMDVDLEIYDLDDLEKFNQLLGDLEYLSRIEMNEAAFYTNRSSNIARIRARKWYKKNKDRVRKLQKKLSSNIALKKKKARLRKQRKTVKGQPIRKYHTRSHTNEEYSQYKIPVTVDDQIKYTKGMTFAEYVRPVSESMTKKIKKFNQKKRLEFLVEKEARKL